tara:strand:+ start:10171 stop:11964 length:1794 start_codon:yes stop_codon:yes gene_type:complete
MSVLQKLTEGIVNRNLSKEGDALRDKWNSTGLLEGLATHNVDTMCVLLENQAKELLRESSTMAAGDVEGFASVAFPIVRRVFGKLIANELVSVQPMSLPSGLIFFLDFSTTATADLDTSGRLGYANNESVYGGGVLASQLTGGVQLTGSNAEKGFYNLNNGYASVTGSSTVTVVQPILSGTFGGTVGNSTLASRQAAASLDLTHADELMKLCRYDADFVSGTTTVCIGELVIATMEGNATNTQELNVNNLISVSGAFAANAGESSVRRLTQLSGTSNTSLLLFLVNYAGGTTPVQLSSSMANGINSTGVTWSWAAKDTLTAGNGMGSVVGAEQWGLEAEVNIPEIDVKVDSVAITAVTKKLKAKWSPELGQDLNAYHNLDAEVELTSILSEQIALEIDREILEDLVKGSKAGTYYWSRRPGRFVVRDSGKEISTYANESLLGADFTGTVSEWYETLVETINDVSAQIHRKTLRGGANFIVCGPEVANLLEFTSGFRASVTHDDDRGTVGALKAGSLSKKWDVWVDPYFPRNIVLVGRRGSSFLESGFVYAPYVPLQVTPTIFGTEDFVPRKGVMTRYGKKMVRPDMYGLVIVQDMLG